MFKDLARLMTIKWFKAKYPNTKLVGGYFCSSVAGFYSQAGQDAFLYSEFFSEINLEKVPKVFVDIGCNHPTVYSNSYFFEKNLGFQCYCVDPLSKYNEEWREIRPSAVLRNVALGSSNGYLDLSVPLDTCESGQIRHQVDMFSTLGNKNKKNAPGDWESIKVPVQTPKDLFVEFGLKEIGIVSVDVEGFENEVLRGIDFDSTLIYIAIIENNATGRLGSNDIRSFMREKGFAFYARFWGLDDVYVHTSLLNSKGASGC